MTTAPTTGRSRTPLIGAIAAAVVVVIVVIIVIVLLTRDDSSSTTVPPLTPAEQQAGILRVTYPDRSLPDQPTATTVGGERITFYLDGVHGSSGGPEAVLRVGVGDAKPSTLILTKGETATVRGFEVRLVAAYDTGDVSTEAADVSVATP